MSTLQDAFSRFLSDRPDAFAAPSEAAYKAHWQTLGEQDPLALAFAGGAIADRLAWVFAAAYQGAVRACFDGARDGAWIALCVSEDRTGEFPGVVLENGMLTGSKSWIAASDTVDQLIVSVGPSLHGGCHLLERNDPGVELVARPRKAFLGDLSQGAANLTSASAGTPVDLARADRFGVAEPFFVVVAAMPYLAREGARLDEPVDDALAGIVRDLDGIAAAGFHSDVRALLDVQQRCAAIGKVLARRAEGTTDGPGADWAEDGRLLGMYGRGLRARAQSD